MQPGTATRNSTGMRESSIPPIFSGKCYVSIYIYMATYTDMCICIYIRFYMYMHLCTHMYRCGQAALSVPQKCVPGPAGCQRGKGSPCLQVRLWPPAVLWSPHQATTPTPIPVLILPLEALSSRRHSGCLVPLVSSLNFQPRGHIRLIKIRSITPELSV